MQPFYFLESIITCQGVLPGFHSSCSGRCARSCAHLCGGTGRLGQPPAWSPFPVARWWWTFRCFSKLVLKSTEACWVLAEICPCQTWHVGWWFAVTIAKFPRGSPLKEAKRDYDSFSSFMFELANTKGEWSMWAGSRAGSSNLGVQMIWSIRCEQTLSWMLVGVLVMPVPALCGADWFHRLRIDTICTLSSMNSGTGTQPPVCCLLFSVSQ